MPTRREFLLAAAGGTLGYLNHGSTRADARQSDPPAARPFGLALGGGAAKALAHIPVLEAIDDLGETPAVIAGTSMGAVLGACYASGLSGREIRDYTVDLFDRRLDTIRRLFPGNPAGWGSIFSFGTASVLKPEKLMTALLPPEVPDTFEALEIPFKVVAADFHRQTEVVLETGKLRPALGASSALPVLLSPVIIDGQVLIDGGFVNPTPFDLLNDGKRFSIGVDVTGNGGKQGGKRPGPVEVLVGSTQLALHSIVNEKLKHSAPDLLVRPDVGSFESLDFYRVKDILAASEPVKEDVKRALESLR